MRTVRDITVHAEDEACGARRGVCGMWKIEE